MDFFNMFSESLVTVVDVLRIEMKLILLILLINSALKQTRT